MSSLYDRIVSLCDRDGISPSAMCRKIGVSPTLMSDLKAGRNKNMSAKTVKKISEFFGVNMGYIVNGEEEIPQEEAELNQYLNDLRDRPEMKMLFKAGRGKNKEQIEAVANLLMSFKNE